MVPEADLPKGSGVDWKEILAPTTEGEVTVEEVEV